MEQLPPLNGGYPTIAVISATAPLDALGWAVMYSDVDGATVLIQGTDDARKRNMSVLLAEYALAEAKSRHALIRTVKHGVIRELKAMGAEEYIDVATNMDSTDASYVLVRDELQRAAEDLGKRLEASRERVEDRPALVIATDGSRSRNGNGAWAWIDEEGRYQTKAGPCANSLQAEMFAIALALGQASKKRPIHILSDSRAAIRLARLAIAESPVPENSTLATRHAFHAIRRAAEGHYVTFEWVKGHNGHPLNDRADRLAVLARRALDGLPREMFRTIANRIASFEDEGVAA